MLNTGGSLCATALYVAAIKPVDVTSLISASLRNEHECVAANCNINAKDKVVPAQPSNSPVAPPQLAMANQQPAPPQLGSGIKRKEAGDGHLLPSFLRKVSNKIGCNDAEEKETWSNCDRSQADFFQNY